MLYKDSALGRYKLSGLEYKTNKGPGEKVIETYYPMMLIRWRTLPRIRFLGPSPPDASFTSHSPPPSSLLWARRRNQDVWGNEKDTVASVSKGRQAIISEETHLLRSGGFLLDLRVEGGHSLRALTHQVEANPQGRCGLTPQTSQTLNSRSREHPKAPPQLSLRRRAV